MPSYQEWVRKIDINIDYYSAFIKSWIAFNSWYRSEYTERTDRGIIEKLKTENNRFKGYIETMLDENNNSDEAIIFKKNLKVTSGIGQCRYCNSRKGWHKSTNIIFRDSNK